MAKISDSFKFAVVMSAVTTFFVTLVLILVNYGFVKGFFFIWMRSWFIACTMVTMAILYLAPLIRRFINGK